MKVAYLPIITASAWLFSACCYGENAAPFSARTWYSISGKTIEASYMSNTTYHAYLLSKDGKQIKVGLNDISGPDRAYIADAVKVISITTNRYETTFYKSNEIKLACSRMGWLSIEGDGISDVITPEEFKAALQKGLEWSEKAKTSGLEVEGQRLLDRVESKAGCLDGMWIRFTAKKAVSADMDVSFEMTLFKERWPSFDSFKATFKPKDFEEILAAMKSIPFDLLSDHLAIKEARQKNTFN